MCEDKKKKRGFTLIELLVSIGVMAVVAAGVVVIIGQGSRQYGRDTRRRADLQMLSSALGAYRNDAGNYPLCSLGSNCASSSITNLVPSGYITSLPVDPDTARLYRYQPQPDGCNNGATRCTGYRLCMSLEKVPNPTPAVVLCGTGTDCDNTTASVPCYEVVVNQ